MRYINSKEAVMSLDALKEEILHHLKKWKQRDEKTERETDMSLSGSKSSVRAKCVAMTNVPVILFPCQGSGQKLFFMGGCHIEIKKCFISLSLRFNVF